MAAADLAAAKSAATAASNAIAVAAIDGVIAGGTYALATAQEYGKTRIAEILRVTYHHDIS